MAAYGADFDCQRYSVQKQKRDLPASRDGSRQLLVMLSLEGLNPPPQGGSCALQVSDRHQVRVC